MPMAVRCAPGMGCARNPRDSTFRQTSRTCSSVAWDFITTNIGSLLRVRLQCNELALVAAISANREIISEIIVPAQPIRRGEPCLRGFLANVLRFGRNRTGSYQGHNRGITGN